MKKPYLILVLILVVCLSACSLNKVDKDISTTEAQTTVEPTTQVPSTQVPSTQAESSEADTTALLTTEPVHIQGAELPLPKETAVFSFMSGAGAWRTTLTLNRDGSFTGFYLDSEMGERDEKLYPNGSAYISVFSGRFTNIQKLNDYSYKMVLTEIKTDKPVGEEWIENKIRYIAGEPYGLNVTKEAEGNKEFIFYIPQAPVSELPEDFLSWWPYRFSEKADSYTTLSCYAIMNVSKEYGFFYIDPAEMKLDENFKETTQSASTTQAKVE